MSCLNSVDLQNVMTELVMHDTRLVKIFESLRQYSEFFESSYDASLVENLVRSTCRDCVSFGFLQGAVDAT